MKRILLAGLLIFTAGISALMAQAQPAGRPAGQPAAQPAGQAGAAPGAPAQPAPVTEMSLVQALGRSVQAGPDAMIKAAEALLTAFPATQYREAALSVEAAAYGDKRDNDAARAKWEEVLKINPKNVQANLRMGTIIALGVKEKALTRDEDVASANKFVATTLDLLKTMAKPNAGLPDADWEAEKKAMEGEAHDALGMMNLNIKKYDVSVQEFQAAVAADPQPAYNARLAMALEQSGKHEEAAAVCDKLLADPQLHPQIKDVVTKLKEQALKAKK